MNLTYTPDIDTKVHEEGAIRLICAAFQSHEAGLPEWLKNASDEYARRDTSEENRVIVVLLENGRGGRKPSISCLDFSGMTSEIIEGSFRIWADPEASIRGNSFAKVQGGHGNGGKCYMTQNFDDYSLIYTAVNGEGNTYGVSSGSIKFGYIPNRSEGRNFPVPNLSDEIGKALQSVGSKIEALPDDAKIALQNASGFTLVSGVGPKGYQNRIPAQQLLNSLQEHPQMIQTLELCKVYIVHNGIVLNHGKPLSVPPIPPMEGADEDRVVKIPEQLIDPVTNEIVSTTDEGVFAEGEIVLRTSNVSMRRSRKGRHSIIFKANSGYIGYVPVSELDVQSPYYDRIYGECRLGALERFKQNDRARLAKAPTTRAVEAFISEEVQKYAKEFEARDKKRYDKEEKAAISKINEALDKWKNRFLNELMKGRWGAGGEGPTPPGPGLPSGRVDRIEVTLNQQRAGLNVAFRPSVKFFDKDNKRVRPVPYRWVSDDNNIAMVDDDLMVINTFAYGHTEIHAETVDGTVVSNKVPLEVVRIHEIAIDPNSIELPVGGRQKLDAMCKLSSGDQTNAVYLVWTESDPNVARVSSSGMVFGFNLGEAEVVAGDDNSFSKESCKIKVIEGRGRSKGDDQGRGYPLVLVSGEIDSDPDTNEYVNFSREEPPIQQRPQDVDRNIWWINSSSPMAQLYLDTSIGYGYQSREWRMYHLERYIDVIVQIALTNGPSEMEALSVSEWINHWGAQVAEIQAAAASDLSDFIATGELPTE